MRQIKRVLLGWLLVAGCAQVELDQEPQRCDEQPRCAVGERCDRVSGRCEPIAPDLMTADLGALDQGAPDAAPDLAPDLDAPDQEQDTPPDMPCAPACGAGELCVAGRCEVIGCEPACVGAEACVAGRCEAPAAMCMPACEAGQTCTQAGCAWPQCQRAGARCEVGQAAQGAFYCVASRSDGRGRCFAACGQEGSAQGCDAGQRCERHTSGGLVCEEAECASDAQCAGGTCVAYEGGYARCEAAGQAAIGQACDVRQPSQRCVQGALCVDGAGSAASGAGTCRKKCDLWGVIAGCQSPQVCVPATARQGVCASAARDGFGDMVSEPCMTPGSWCADGTICVDGRAQDVCARLCRPERGAQDCRTHVSDVSQCNSYYFPGDRETGGCDLDCSMSPSVCGAQATCQGGVCRRRCAAATVAEDCCGGVRPCPWRCVNDLCE